MMNTELTAAHAHSRDTILGVVFALLALGVVMVYSAVGGSTTDVARADHALKMNAARLCVGLAGLVVLAWIDYHLLCKFALPLLGLNIVLLCAVYACPRVNGSHRWMPVIGNVKFQPSEMAKLVLLLYLATYLANQGDEVRKFRRGFMFPTLAVGLVGGLIFFERDLGTSALIVAVSYIVMLCAGTRFVYVCGLACVSLPVLFAAVRNSPYQWVRIITYLNPWAYADTTGYHTVQSLIALGSGGWTGAGLGRGMHKLCFVPETRADSIFCVIGEELGFVGAALVVVAFLLLMREGIRVALRAPDKQGSLLAFGITITLAMQAAINIAVATASVPNKGMPLPFVSAGGSAMLFGLCSIGVLLNIAKQGVMREPVAASPARVEPAPLPQPAP